MTRKEYKIPSKAGFADLFVRAWIPENPKAVFQIAHGMAEHGERYEDTASYLCSKGFIVVVDDHIGHGRSTKTNSDYGYFGEKNGWSVFVEDEKSVTELIKKEFPSLPIIFFGHSMGSFIGREYICRYGDDKALKGAIICGTSGKNPAAPIAIKLADGVAKIKGSKYRSNFINGLAFGTYNKKIANPRTDFDWLTTDEKIVDAYISDKECGYLFTATGYRDLFTILNVASSKKCFEGVNKDLPILLTAGEEDPVGAYGKGVTEVFNNYKDAGVKDVTLKLWPGMRHEIHNENGREKVYEALATWAEEKLSNN